MVPFHEPELAVSTEPTVVVPLIVGGDWFVGAASLAAIEKPATASTVTQARPRVARAEKLSCFMVPLSELHICRSPVPECNPMRPCQDAVRPSDFALGSGATLSGASGL